MLAYVGMPHIYNLQTRLYMVWLPPHTSLRKHNPAAGERDCTYHFVILLTIKVIIVDLHTPRLIRPLYVNIVHMPHIISALGYV